MAVPRRPLGVLVSEGVVASAEMVGSVLPVMFAGAAATAIVCPQARRLYTLLCGAFARRRSLLLLNLERQVRMEELPWARPLVALLAAGEADAAGASARRCEAALREAVLCYLTHFPATLPPNKLIGAMKDALRLGAAGAPRGHLTEELAADIFQNAFSPSFDKAAHIAALTMAGSVYSRYYGLEETYASIAAAFELSEKEAMPVGVPTSSPAVCTAKATSVKDMLMCSIAAVRSGWFASGANAAGLGTVTEQKAVDYRLVKATRANGDRRIDLFGLATAKMSSWGAPHSGRLYDATQGGRAVEASMVITTHNLAQMVDMLGGLLDFDFAEAARVAFASIVSIYANPLLARSGWYALLHARRDVAYAWRHILFYISRVGVNATYAAAVEGANDLEEESAQRRADAAAAAINAPNALSPAGLEAQRSVLLELRRVLDARVPSQSCAEAPSSASSLGGGVHSFISAHFLDPLEALIDGAGCVPIKRGADGSLSAEKGDIVLGYYGWDSLQPQ